MLLSTVYKFCVTERGGGGQLSSLARHVALTVVCNVRWRGD